ncbi:hypothetical protein LPB86_05980 [Pedobacter sp. MC2016-14]|uniref:hypothetical protein n=1 Tax=Pedobacter sp. MC2016-14 TaxID=2897327 RepID=UPI001E535E12|nr:hypothetical protein [Pedobacter sp. MC2016-14]MCD0487766.1 hypothetical protein [Pedobacter sp. MC2016-14]
MFYALISAAIIFFLAHLILLLTAFPQSKLAGKRYFYSHLTLWFTGLFIFILALLYSGTGQSNFLDYFDTPTKKAMILVFTMALSLVAHTIVKYVVLPLLQKNLEG